MERIQLQGRALTIRDHQRAGLSRFRSPSSPVDFNKLRADFDACMFVGPPTPLRLRRELSDEADPLATGAWSMNSSVGVGASSTKKARLILAMLLAIN